MYSFQTSNQPVSWPHILTVALLAIGAVAVRWEIQADRPDPSGQGVSTRGIQNIDARLWQDPFGPISKADQASKHTPYTLCELKAMVKTPDAKIRVITALVSGGKWVRADEARRRARYAILSGLAVENYTPYDPEHIGHARDDLLDTQLDIPYEWLEYNPDKAEPDKTKPDLLLVLWIDEDTLLVNADSRLRESSEQHGPLARLDAIRSKFITDDDKRFSFSVIGPSSSTLLTATNEETDEPLEQSPGKATPWHSPLATIPDVNFGNFLRQAGKRGFDFKRLITTDEQLAAALAGELALRRIGGADSIALIAQRDTAYSRELLKQMRKQLQPNRTGSDAENSRLIEFGYLRGIDGRLPGGDAKDKKKDSDKSSTKKEGDGDSQERPEGDAQIDYLRRMVAELERRQNSRHPIKAIGIFGDDYYDKLMIVKALRPAFPQAVFFTTDLDAAMLHPKDNHHLRNLVVASGYGLSLNPGLQRDVPPFRDSYQTATFLAARMAVSSGPTASPKFPPPQIFEMGRSAIVPLTGPKEVDRCTKLEECSTLQLPLAIPRWPAASALPVLMAAMLLGAFANGSIKREHAGPWLIALAIAAVASFSLIYLLRADPSASEPLSVFQGISIWPSTMLRFLAALLAILLILRGRKLIAENQHLIGTRFHLNPSADSKEAASQDKAALCHPDQDQSSEQRNSAVGIWKIYTGRDKSILPAYLRAPHLWTTGGFIICMVLIAGLFVWLFPGPPPNLPARGGLAVYVHWGVLIAALLSFWALLFFALDQTLRANCLAKLHAGRTHWPDETYKAFWPSESGATPEQKVFTDWLDARLIAHATEPIQRIVFYPFLVLALLVLARSSLFDNWNMPAFLYVMFGIPVLLMVGAAWPLRARAEKVRATALRWLHVRLMEEQAKGSEQLVKQIKSMIEQVEHLRTGAFAPFSERPLFKGVLTLVGTLSGVALMDYAHLMGL